ncbi:MAG: hypothetical protein JST62_02935 [Bacteroidetes bacterium]|nr:hypothetical protein [Bacteroidota bacterium]
MLKIKKIAAGASVILIASLIMGILIFCITKILNATVKYPHYEWYMYQINVADSMKFAFLVCLSSYILYKFILILIRRKLKMAFKIFICLLSFLSFHLSFGIITGGMGQLSHPITIRNIIIYILMSCLIPLINTKVFNFMEEKRHLF